MGGRGLRLRRHRRVRGGPGRGAEEAAGGGTCYLQVGDVDLWHSGWTAAGYQPSAIEVMPWGMREFRIADPSGNTIRVGQPSPDPSPA